MVKLEIELTEQEASYLTIEMNMLLRSYGCRYAGQYYENDDMGSVFNKTFKGLTGKDHEQYLKMKKLRKQEAESKEGNQDDKVLQV